jgi:hypothetical protein
MTEPTVALATSLKMIVFGEGAGSLNLKFSWTGTNFTITDHGVAGGGSDAACATKGDCRPAYNMLGIEARATSPELADSPESLHSVSKVQATTKTDTIHGSNAGVAIRCVAFVVASFSCLMPPKLIAGL